MFLSDLNNELRFEDTNTIFEAHDGSTIMINLMCYNVGNKQANVNYVIVANINSKTSWIKKHVLNKIL